MQASAQLDAIALDRSISAMCEIGISALTRITQLCQMLHLYDAFIFRLVLFGLNNVWFNDCHESVHDQLESKPY